MPDTDNDEVRIREYGEYNRRTYRRRFQWKLQERCVLK
jgi:hypothetical protein